MTRRTPDHDIDLRARHPEFQTHLDWNEQHSEQARQRHACRVDVPYGPHPLQRFDLFPGRSGDAPCLVFVHGGYWRALDKRSYGFVALPFVEAGFSVAVLNYRLMPEVRMGDVVSDVRAGCATLLDGAVADHGLHPRRLALVGHSAGGHLVVTATVQDRALSARVSAVASLSGLFDLQRIRASRLDDTLALTDEEVQRYSPLPAVPTVPVHASVGGDETALFLTETDALAQHAGVEARRYPGLNHYQVAHLLADADASPTRFLLDALREP